VKQKLTIGRSDKVDLPDLGIENAKVKIDTGAYTSSIHCKKIEIKEGILSFQLPVDLLGKSVIKNFQTREYFQKKVRSSNGQQQLRYVIRTHIVIFGKSYKAEFSLTDRSKMKNPILIGRKLLKDRFIVDVSKKNLSFEHKKSINQQ